MDQLKINAETRLKNNEIIDHYDNNNFNISTEEALSNNYKNNFQSKPDQYNKLDNTLQLLEESQSHSITLNKKLNNTYNLLNDKTSFLMESQNKLQKTNNFLKNGNIILLCNY